MDKGKLVRIFGSIAVTLLWLWALSRAGGLPCRGPISKLDRSESVGFMAAGEVVDFEDCEE